MRAISIITRWEGVLGTCSGDALRSPDGTTLRTWAGIESESRILERDLVHGTGCVVLQTGNHPSFPALLLASWRAGRAVCLMDPGMTGSVRAELESHVGAGLRVTSENGALHFEELPSGTTHDAEICLFKTTSGTTAVPRAIPFSARQLLADCDQVCTTMGISGTDWNFGLISFCHSYGFSNLVTPLLCRGVPMVVAHDALPRAVQSGVATSGATVLPLVPAMFRALCSVDCLAPSLRLCISAGAPLDAAVAAAFRNRFGRKIHAFYGASECGGICYDRSEEPHDETGFVGTPMDNVFVEWLDGASPSPAGARIRVLSRAVGGTGSPRPDVFEPADLLVRDGDGFRIVGREADLINCGGRKVAPAEIEHVLVRCPGVREAVVFGAERNADGQKILALIVGDGTIDPRTVRLHCSGVLAPWQIPREFHFVTTIPVNERGKVSRQDLARIYG